MDDFLMKPKIDFAFKEIMADEYARTGFLSSVLNLNPEDIRETRLLNTFLRKSHENDKLGILDVRILLNNDLEIDVEIQLAEFGAWAERSLFYLSKMYTENIESGQKYDTLKKCVSISILDFVLFKEHSEFYSCFHLREDTHNFLFTDKIEFHLIELPKLPTDLKENNRILLWARFINSEKKEDFDMLAEKDPYIKSAYNQLQVISQDKEKRLEYEAREKAVRDHNQLIFEAEQRGWKAGEQHGWKAGEQHGWKAGEQSEKTATAIKLIKMGFDTDIIIQVTDLPIDQIAPLQAKYGNAKNDI